MRLYSFKDIVGNKNSLDLIKSSLERDTLDNFIILSGITGTGKSTTAEIIGLSKTCHNPVNGEPCLKCPSCVANLKALAPGGDGRTSNLVKVNLGRINNKKDIEELIKEIFVLESPVGNLVYILEEVHATDAIPNAQTAFLEEIERLSDNVYVIMCTTRPYRIIEELRDRAINYNFNRLTPQECKLLFDNTCKRLGIETITKSTERMIIKKSKAIPRVLVKMIDYVYKNSPTEKQLESYFGFVSTEVFSQLLTTMDLGMADTSKYLDELLSVYGYDTLVEQFKDYILNALFYLTGGIEGNLTNYDKKVIKELLDGPKLFKICKQVKNISPRNCTENDFKFLMIDVAQVIKNKKVPDILKENLQNASQQKMDAQKLSSELKKLEIGTEADNLKTVSNLDLRERFSKK
ncbi:AAA family ATPase [Paraclostridium bifermentans]|uniref:AAA family ATPase n=1 Tax=Paraclostridium bifermentans TaxID=1490 RepID=UPI00374F67B2